MSRSTPLISMEAMLWRSRSANCTAPWLPVSGTGHSFARSGQYTRTVTVIDDTELGRSVVGGVGDLEAKGVQPVGRRVHEHDRVVLVLVPALEEHAVGLPPGLDEPDDLAVIGRGQFEVRHPDLDV